MQGVNKVILIGNLGKDPEVRYTQGGTTVANFSIATTESWKNKQTGDLDKKTEWHNVVCWNRLGELARDYLSKGRPVYIEGKLQTRKWEDKDGNTRYTTEVVANTLQFLGSRDDAGDRPIDSQSSQMSQAMKSNAGATNEPPPFDDDDIPF